MSKKCKDNFKNIEIGGNDPIYTYKSLETGEEFDVIGDPAVKEGDTNFEKQVKVSIKWSNQIPIKKQLILLLKIQPLHDDKSRQEILSEIQISNNEWCFGEFPFWKAIDIKEEGNKQGLTILIYD